ncbi:MAG: LysE family transporter [Alphaproteobacteria bacterium]
MEHAPQIAVAWLIYLAAAIAPGPDFLVIAGETLRGSRARGLLAALGVSTGTCVWVSGTSLGLVLVLAEFSQLSYLLRLLGGLYLLYLGFRTLRGAVAPGRADAAAAKTQGGLGRAYLSGLLANLGNPKTAVFFLSVLALLAAPDTPAWVHLATGTGMVAISIGWYSLVAVALSHPRVGRAYGRLRRWIDAVIGGLFAAFGGHLILSR